MGQRCSDTRGIRFEDVRVPAKNVIGKDRILMINIIINIILLKTIVIYRKNFLFEPEKRKELVSYTPWLLLITLVLPLPLQQLVCPSARSMKPQNIHLKEKLWEDPLFSTKPYVYCNEKKLKLI